jgi:hypothetical protein
MQQRLILLLTKVNRTHESKRAVIEAELEQCKEHLDDLDVIIERLRRKNAENSKSIAEKLEE